MYDGYLENQEKKPPYDGELCGTIFRLFIQVLFNRFCITQTLVENTHTYRQTAFIDEVVLAVAHSKTVKVNRKGISM